MTNDGSHDVITCIFSIMHWLWSVHTIPTISRPVGKMWNALVTSKWLGCGGEIHSVPDKVLVSACRFGPPVLTPVLILVSLVKERLVSPSGCGRQETTKTVENTLLTTHQGAGTPLANTHRTTLVRLDRLHTEKLFSSLGVHGGPENSDFDSLDTCVDCYIDVKNEMRQYT